MPNLQLLNEINCMGQICNRSSPCDVIILVTKLAENIMELLHATGLQVPAPKGQPNLLKMKASQENDRG